MSFKIVVDSCCDLPPAMLKDPVFFGIFLRRRIPARFFTIGWSMKGAIVFI